MLLLRTTSIGASSCCTANEKSESKRDYDQYIYHSSKILQTSEYHLYSLMPGNKANNTVTANLPLFFTLHLPVFFGFRVNDNYSASHQWLDLQEGEFVDQHPTHPHFLDDKQAYVTSQLLKVQQPGELNDIKLNHDFRRNLLHRYEVFYALHISDFGTLKTLPVLREILG